MEELKENYEFSPEFKIALEEEIKRNGINKYFEKFLLPEFESVFQKVKKCLPIEKNSFTFQLKLLSFVKEKTLGGILASFEDRGFCRIRNRFSYVKHTKKCVFMLYKTFAFDENLFKKIIKEKVNFNHLLIEIQSLKRYHLSSLDHLSFICTGVKSREDCPGIDDYLETLNLNFEKAVIPYNTALALIFSIRKNGFFVTELFGEKVVVSMEYTSGSYQPRISKNVPWTSGSRNGGTIDFPAKIRLSAFEVTLYSYKDFLVDSSDTLFIPL
ncbi:MAG: hypothetical protein V4439_03925 [Patescibacteria group bacterium]